MKIRHLILSCAIGLVSATPALAAFVEGSINLEALRAQPSVAPEPFTVTTKGNGRHEGDMFSQLAMQHQSNLAIRAVAGRSGQEIGGGDRGAITPPNESVFDTIRRTYH